MPRLQRGAKLTKEQMKMTTKEINSAILALPLERYQREMVRNLIQGITGLSLVERIYRLGDKFTLDGEPCMIVVTGEWQIGIIHTKAGSKYGDNVSISNGGYFNISQDEFDRALGKYKNSKIVIWH